MERPTLRSALCLSPTDDLPLGCSVATHGKSRREVLAFGTCYLVPEEYLEGYGEPVPHRYIKWRVVGMIPGSKEHIIRYHCVPVGSPQVALDYLLAAQKRVEELVRLRRRRKRQFAALKFVHCPVPSTVPNETNDCGVVAIATLMNVSYAKAHEWCRVRGRKNRRGTQLHHYLSKAPGGWVVPDPDRPAHAFRMTEVSTPYFVRGGEPRYNGTLLSFVRDHPEGRFLVVSSGHAYCVIDGAVWDGNSEPVSPLSRIVYAFQAR